MPHLTLSYTANMDQDVDCSSVFSKMHRILVDVGKIEIANCKSRAVKLDDYYIGEGQESNAFVQLDVRFLEGRSAETKKEIGRRLLGVLKECYAPSLARYNLQITVEIREIEREDYFKIPEGTLPSP